MSKSEEILRIALEKIALSYQPSNKKEFAEWHETVREIAIKALKK